MHKGRISKVLQIHGTDHKSLQNSISAWKQTLKAYKSNMGTNYKVLPYHITPPIMNHRSCDELGTYIPVT